MSKKITQADVKRMHDHVFRCGAEEMHNLLRYHERIGYTSGIYGWNADIYSVYSEKYGRVAIVTGYRCFGMDSDKKTIVKHEYAVKKYKEKYYFSGNYDRVEKYTEKRLKKCVDEVIENALKGA